MELLSNFLITNGGRLGGVLDIADDRGLHERKQVDDEPPDKCRHGISRGAAWFLRLEHAYQRAVPVTTTTTSTTSTTIRKLENYSVIVGYHENSGRKAGDCVGEGRISLRRVFTGIYLFGIIAGLIVSRFIFAGLTFGVGSDWE